MFEERRDDIRATFLVFFTITAVMFTIVICCLTFNYKSTCRNCKNCLFDFADGVREVDCSCCKSKPEEPKKKKILVDMSAAMRQIAQNARDAREAEEQKGDPGMLDAA